MPSCLHRVVLLVVAIAPFLVGAPGAAAQDTTAARQAYNAALEAERRGDNAAAIPLLRRAADAGYAPAQASLGWRYRYGSGVQRDLAEAMRLFRLAADQGDAYAAFNVGEMYEHGAGREPDLEEALRWYRASAAKNHWNGRRSLASLEAAMGTDGAGMALGTDFTCVRGVDALVRCMGAARGLGTGARTPRLHPDTLKAFRDSVAALEGEGGFACALLYGGSVRCWGRNTAAGVGVGDGTSEERLTPVAVSGLRDGVRAIAVGSTHACALLQAGTVRCWGSNAHGQLGDGTQVDRLTPVAVAGLGGVRAITAGWRHTCALLADATVRCWGANAEGQLGDGTTTPRLLPTPVASLASVQAISAGSEHTCAVSSSGRAQCWGGNATGALGDGSAARRLVPGPVTGLASGVRTISAGVGYTCAVLAAGGVRCWGLNRGGSLGDGTTTPRAAPVNVVGLTAPIGWVETSTGHTCAMSRDLASRWCWGDNSTGQLGDGTREMRPRPVTQITPQRLAMVSTDETIAANSFTSCAIHIDRSVRCWGNRGIDPGPEDWTAQAIPGMESGIVAIGSGDQHFCGVTAAGAVRCFGANGSGQLGDGTKASRRTSVAVVGLSAPVRTVAGGGSHTCALTTTGGVKCWGSNSSGQLGDGTTTDRATPVDVGGLTSGVVAIGAGSAHTCALLQTGGVKCWGANTSGQLGINWRASRQELTPADVSELQLGAVDLAVGSFHNCVVWATRTVRCWGGNRDGELGSTRGQGTWSDRPVDGPALHGPVADVVAAFGHTCVVLANGGTIYCWGDNEHGELGDHSRLTSRVVPHHANPSRGWAITGITSVRSIVGGVGHTCGLTTAGRVACWGTVPDYW